MYNRTTALLRQQTLPYNVGKLFRIHSEIKRKKKGKSPKSHNSKQFSPKQGQNGVIVNSSNHRESSIHLPLKEFEVPDFLKDTQSQKLQGNSSPIVKRDLKDSDFSTMNGSGLMIPREELTIPDFLRMNDESEKHDTAVEKFKSGHSQQNRGAETQGRVHKSRLSQPNLSNGRILNADERDYSKMNGEHGSHERSRDSKGNQEIRGIQKLQENSRVVEYQKEVHEASSKRFAPPGKASNNRKLSAKTSSDTDSDFKLHTPHTVVFADMGGEEGFSSDEFSLKRKYKKESSRKVTTAGQNGRNEDLIERLRPSVKTQLEAGGRRKSNNWVDTDSLQSSSSQSFTEPTSTMSSDKDKFSVSVRDHGDLARKGITTNGILSSAGKLHLDDTSNSHVEGDLDSPLSTARSSNLNTSINYNESSPEKANCKVKRKDSLQARLRNRITKLERANKAFPRARHDSDSTTISDHSAFEEILPMNYSRKKSTPAINSLNDLPDNILIFIFSHLTTTDLCRASGVCQKWQTLCWDPLLWSSINITNYQDSDINKVLRTILSKLAMDSQGYCLSVHTIKLNGCELLSDKGLGFIARFCIDLDDLDVSGCCCITSKGLHELLSSCHGVTHLDVSGCTCVNSLSAPVAIANGLGLGQNGAYLKLQHLDLSDCVAFDDLGLRVVGLSCTVLESLYLRRCNRVTDVGMKHVAQHCSGLKELSISDCFKVRDFSLKEIAKNCASLKYLSVAKCPVTDTGMKYIGKHCVKLKYLNVRGCEAVSDVGISHIVQNCLKLRSLDAGKCDITDTGLQVIGIHCPQLKKLSVRGCDGVTDVGVKTIAAQCCSLQYLNVQECSLTYETFMYTREHCKNCVIEHTCPAFF